MNTNNENMYCQNFEEYGSQEVLLYSNVETYTLRNLTFKFTNIQNYTIHQ